MAPNSEKTIFIISDFIEESSVINLAASKYSHSPNLIKSDTDSLIQKIDHDFGQHLDLNGVQFIFIVNVIPEQEELAVQASRFFQEFVRRKGGQIQVRANI